MTDDVRVINYAEIRISLDELGQAVANRIDRDLRPEVRAIHPGLPMVLKLMVRVSRVTWGSIAYLVADKPDDPSRRAEFALSIPMLSRSILDALFATVFIFEDPSERAAWFFRSTWREAAEQHSRLLAAYQGDEEWEVWLQQHEEQVEGFRTDAQLPETAQPQSARYWPNPGAMWRETTDPVRKEFLGYLKDWFYKELSGESHLSGIGFAKRAGLLADVPDHVQAQHQETNEAYRHQSLLAALVLYVALLTELTCQLDMTHQKGHARRIWGVLNEWPPARDVWARRYEQWLGDGDR